MNPPSVLSAIRLFISLLQAEVPYSVKVDLIELSRFLSELSVCDYFFIVKKTSSIGLACVLTAFEGIPQAAFPKSLRQQFVNDVHHIAKINCTIDEVHACRLRLRNIYGRGNFARPRKNNLFANERGSGGYSPTSASSHAQRRNESNINPLSYHESEASVPTLNSSGESIDAFPPVQITSDFVSAEVDFDW